MNNNNSNINNLSYVPKAKSQKSKRSRKAAENFSKYHEHSKNSTGNYEVAATSMSVDDKLKFLEEIGRSDMIDLFKDWKPRRSKARKRGAPLDQRVTITVTAFERSKLDMEIKDLKKQKQQVNMSQIIRNRAIGNIDINGWADKAKKALEEIEDTAKKQKELREQKINYSAMADEETDDDVANIYLNKSNEINKKLNKIVSLSFKRNNRLSGRMTMPESETVKWRAQRLCLSTSDYLRMVIFDFHPDSDADAHLSLNAKRRFYFSIIEVAQNGWGTPPKIYECSQCETYMEDIRKLKAENEQLRKFI